MRAVQFKEFGGPIEVVDVERPSPGSNEAVISVHATGLCRSDWHGWHGHDPDIKTLPHVPGHEFSGVIDAAGERVKSFSIGDRVAVPFILACGECTQCSNGDPQVCPNQRQPGFTHWGSFAEYVLVPYADNNLIRLPDEVTMATAAALGCRFTTAYRAVVQQGRVAEDEWVAVYGCGGVGLSALLCAKAAAARVVAIDTNPEALALAASLGADRTLVMGPEVNEEVVDLTDGGPHLGVDAIGHPNVVTASVGSLRPRGRHVQVGLLVGDHSPTPVSLDRVISKELEILGSHGASPEVFAGLFAMISDGRLDPSGLITREIGLEDIPEAMESFADHGPGMTVALLE